MTRTIRQVGPAIVVVLIAALGAGVRGAAGQDPSGRPPAGPRGAGGPGGPMGHGRGPGGPLGVVGLPLERLGLTEVQRGQIKAIMDAHRAELRATGERTMTAQRAVDDAIAADAVNEGTIRARSAELAAVAADMAVIRARVRADVFQILTPEQQAQAKQIQADMKQRAGAIRHHPPHRQ